MKSNPKEYGRYEDLVAWADEAHKHLTLLKCWLDPIMEDWDVRKLSGDDASRYLRRVGELEFTLVELERLLLGLNPSDYHEHKRRRDQEILKEEHLGN